MSLAEEYKGLEAQMELIRDGGLLRAAADSVLMKVVPGKPTIFIATSETGAAVAAVCAARFSDEARWMRLNLLVETDLPEGWQKVVVEVVDAGAAWRRAIARRVRPDLVVIPEQTEDLRLASA